MGPIILCDKSALQCLHAAEMDVVRRYYHLNVPPILVSEILGDLKLPPDDGRIGKHEVQVLTRRLIFPSYAVSRSFKQIILDEIDGRVISPDIQIPVNANSAMSADGKPGFRINSASEQAIFNWQEGKFTEAEEVASEEWRASIKRIDLEGLRQKLNSELPKKLKYKTATEALEFVDDFLACTDPLKVTTWFFGDAGIQGDVVKRAGALTTKPLTGFRYTHHCIRVNLLFHVALMCNIIGPRSTNRFDMEYMYYVPFCQAFCSGDKLHMGLPRKNGHRVAGIGLVVLGFEVNG
jgi:hypothetical protein